VPGTVIETETRSVAAVPAAVPLSAVHKVYIEAVGDEILGQSVREMLGERLRRSSRIVLARDRDEADALLRVSATRSADSKPKTANVLVQLINARGDVMWPNANSGGKYQGYPADVSASIVKDLLVAIQKSRQRR